MVCHGRDVLDAVTGIISECGVTSVIVNRSQDSCFLIPRWGARKATVSKGLADDALARITGIIDEAARLRAAPAASPSSGGGSGAGQVCASKAPTQEAGAWTGEEDVFLLDKVAKEGCKFAMIASSLISKTPKQCKDRCVALSALLIPPLISHSLFPRVNPHFPHHFLTPVGFYLAPQVQPVGLGQGELRRGGGGAAFQKTQARCGQVGN